MILRKRFFTVIAVLALMITAFTVTAFAKDGKEASIYRDDASLITNDAAVLDAIAEFERNTGKTIHIVTTEEYYATPFSLGISTAGDVIILIIEKGDYENYYELFIYGEPDSRISTDESDRILDDPEVYDNIKFGDVDTGVLRFISLTETAYLGVLQESLLRTVVISLILAVIIAAIPTIIIIVKYKRKLKSASYPLERYASLSLNDGECSDFFIGSFITKTRINTSSGSRSGGGGGRSGGGGSRGRR